MKFNVVEINTKLFQRMTNEIAASTIYSEHRANVKKDLTINKLQ